MHFESDVPLAAHTTLGLGGRARRFICVTSEEELLLAIEWAHRHRERVWVLGGGSNLVIREEDLPGLVVKIGLRGRSVSRLGSGGESRLTAGAGEPLDDLIRFAVDAGLAGLECLSGVPGLVGATPIQNVGAYGQEVRDTIESVRALDLTSNDLVEIPAEACEFAYRSSRFKDRDRERYVITEVRFRLSPRESSDIRYPELERAVRANGRSPTLPAVRETVLALRKEKSMLADPTDPNGRSCGSFFVNPVVSPELADSVEHCFAPQPMPRYPQADGRMKLSAAWLIERTGFGKGYRRGNVGISTRHALALICHPGAQSKELLALAEEIQTTVRQRCGVALTPEPLIW